MELTNLQTPETKQSFIDALKRELIEIPTNLDELLNTFSECSEEQREIDSRDSKKNVEYKPDYELLIAKACLAYKNFNFLRTKSLIKDFINDFSDMYFEVIEDALPIHIVGNVDENIMIINSYIDIKYDELKK